jgi:hypothetical protein
LAKLARFIAGKSLGGRTRALSLPLHIDGIFLSLKWSLFGFGFWSLELFL